MTQQISFEIGRGNPAANYERYFVPAIGAPLAQDLVELAELQPGERVLDIACGTGIVTRLAAERVGDAAVVGVDINAAMLEIARASTPDTAIECGMKRAPTLFRSATGHSTWCSARWGSSSSPSGKRPCAKCSILKPTGRAVLNVPGPDPPLLAVLERALRRHVGPEAAGFVAMVFSLHQPEELQELMESAGFSDVSARSEHKTLLLPAAENFLWQYVFSTPLSEAAGRLDERQRADLQQEIIADWAPFAEDEGLLVELDITTATGRTA